ncbi:iron-sulfur cluster biosynthesis protein [Actinoalloteichus sp. AHMU CJ021]|uniref:Fe-S cluster assembly iron-binding protein IscA n=1 Tax=Actinoalloteichus caeruleus DSM 43889 TaxID=1120930 RepID=A0ABT1JBM6_ACTCY|nr:iron-sulfur cluster biosynthesis protein [Actinoalloteichus caeruleus]AUS80540.1 iron-sulfur cluster biosynthesis protein [Actinoalloteichus sp. AHMU CJ021]MCP2329902.1 Fe-S cluster assembly iron-binding protein IscA [Actinoalloteichus caeruleus DSM 43889]
MLAVTDAAAEAINDLRNAEGQPDTSGLRFDVDSENEEGAALAVSLCSEPDQEDQVVGSGPGARVFLSPGAVDYLRDKVLDVQPDEDGEMAFALLDQQT